MGGDMGSFEHEHRTDLLNEIASRSERELILMVNFYREHGFEAEAWQIAEEVRELKARHDQS
jgi:hypothetical protein